MSASVSSISAEDIRAAHARIAPHMRRTPALDLGSGVYRPKPGERVGVLPCGANLDLGKLAELA